jgi:hypothetical protein
MKKWSKAKLAEANILVEQRGMTVPEAVKTVGGLTAASLHNYRFRLKKANNTKTASSGVPSPHTDRYRKALELMRQGKMAKEAAKAVGVGLSAFNSWRGRQARRAEGVRARLGRPVRNSVDEVVVQQLELSPKRMVAIFGTPEQIAQAVQQLT